MEIWVQGTLFDPGTAADTRVQPGRGGRGTPRGRFALGGWTRVTRDPAVAASYAESARLSSDVRIGLARALDRLDPTQREAIRRSLGMSRRSAA